jgi:hypothetical protein
MMLRHADADWKIVALIRCWQIDARSFARTIIPDSRDKSTACHDCVTVVTATDSDSTFLLILRMALMVTSPENRSS